MGSAGPSEIGLEDVAPKSPAGAVEPAGIAGIMLELWPHLRHDPPTLASTPSRFQWAYFVTVADSGTPFLNTFSGPHRRIWESWPIRYRARGFGPSRASFTRRQPVELETSVRAKSCRTTPLGREGIGEATHGSKHPNAPRGSRTPLAPSLGVPAHPLSMPCPAMRDNG